MKSWTLSAITFAAALAAGPALAQSTTKTDAIPDAKQPMTSTKPAINNPAKQTSGDKAGGGGKSASAETRDWAKIDSNNDHLVSAEEMEKYLQDNPGPQKK